jgi:DNA-binding transcriptional ArsR family regulator
MTRSKPASSEDRLLKAISHPIRLRILEQLNEREASPSQLARQLGEPIGNLSYHVKVLLKHDAIELVAEKPVRGAIEHFYRATMRPFFDDAHWTKLPLSMRRALFDPMLQKIWDHVVEATGSGGLDDPQTHISWTTLDLDRQGYEDMVELLAQTLDRALEIQSEAAGRLSEAATDETERTELAVMHYHRPRIDEHEAAKAKRSARRQRTKATAGRRQ